MTTLLVQGGVAGPTGVERDGLGCDREVENVDDESALAVRYGIRSIPTLLLFKEGQVLDQVVGVVPKQVLAEKLRALA